MKDKHYKVYDIVDTKDKSSRFTFKVVFHKNAKIEEPLISKSLLYHLAHYPPLQESKAYSYTTRQYITDSKGNKNYQIFAVILDLSNLKFQERLKQLISTLTFSKKELPSWVSYD